MKTIVLVVLVLLQSVVALNSDFSQLYQLAVDSGYAAHSITVDTIDNSLLVYVQIYKTSGAASVNLVRMSANGTVRWTAKYEVSTSPIYCGYDDPWFTVGTEVASPVLIDAASRDIFIHGKIDINGFLGRFASNGTRLWIQQYGQAFPTEIYATSMAMVSPYLLLAGETIGNGFNGQPVINGNDHYLMKVHMFNGSAVWTVIWGTSGWDFLYSISADETSGFVYSSGEMAGRFDGISLVGGDSDLFINRHFISNGSRIPGTIMIGSTGTDTALGMTIDTSRNLLLYVCGYVQGSVGQTPLMSTATDQVIMAVYTQNFTIAWVRLIGGVGSKDFASTISIQPLTGNLYVGGGVSSALLASFTQPYIGGTSDLSLAVYTPQGARIKFITAGSSNRDSAYGSCFDSNTGILYIVGMYNDKAGVYVYNNVDIQRVTISSTASSTTTTGSLTSLTSTSTTTNEASSITTPPSTTVASSTRTTLSSTPSTSESPYVTIAPNSNAQLQVAMNIVTVSVVASSAAALTVLFIFVVFTFRRKHRQKEQQKPQYKPQLNLITPPSLMVDNFSLDWKPMDLVKQLPLLKSSSSRDAEEGKSSFYTANSTTLQLLNMKRVLFVPGHYKVETSAYFPVGKIFTSPNCEVYCCTPIDNELLQRTRNRALAVKYLKKVNSSTMDAFNQEISIMHFFQGRPNIVQLVGFCTEPLAIITDLYSMGSLYDCMYKRQLLAPTRKIIFRFALQICNALSEMHLNGFSHSDLKPHNVFVDKRFGEYYCFLGDFGLARVLDDTHLAVKAYKVINAKGLTARYAAPEVVQTFRGYSTTNVHDLPPVFFLKADIYSIALILLMKLALLFALSILGTNALNGDFKRIISIPFLPDINYGYLCSILYDQTDDSLLMYGSYWMDTTATSDIYLLRLSVNGILKWMESYTSTSTNGNDFCGLLDMSGGVEVQLGSSIIVDPTSKDLFVHGFTEYTQTSQFIGFLGRFASNGTKLWVKQYGPGYPVDIYAMSMAMAYPYLLLAGETQSASQGNGFNGQPSIGLTDHYLIKVHMSNGSAVWTRIWGTPQYDFLYGIAADETSGVVYSTGQNSDAYDGIASVGGPNDLFIDRHFIYNGTRLPKAIMVGSTGIDSGIGLAIDTSRSLLYACGYAEGTVGQTPLMSKATDQLIMAVYTNNFTVAWLRLIGGVGIYDYASTIAIHPLTGYVYVSGSISGALPTSYNQKYYGGESDVSLAVFTPQGTLVRLINSGTSDRDAAFASCFDTNGTLYIAGIYKYESAFYVFENVVSSPQSNITTATISSSSSLTTSITIYASSTTSTSSTTTLNISSTQSPSTTIKTFSSTTISSSTTSLYVTINSSSNGDSNRFTSTGPDQIVLYTFSLTVVASAALALTSLATFVLFMIVKRKTTKAVIINQPQRAQPTLLMSDHVHQRPQSNHEFDLVSQFPIFRHHNTRNNSSKAETLLNSTTTTVTTSIVRKALFVPGSYQVQPSDYYPIRKIFISTNCEVYCCVPSANELIQRCTNRILAVKYLKKVNSSTMDAFNQEISIMHFFQGRPNIVQLVGFCMEPLAIITDLYSMGSLYDCMYERRLIRPNRSLILRFAFQICNALCEMHLNGFSHSDLKPHNVFVDRRNGEYFCLLGDFGLARVLDDTHLAVKAYKVINAKGLTARYAAPEMIQAFRGYTIKSELPPLFFLKADIYSIALILYELLINSTVW